METNDHLEQEKAAMNAQEQLAENVKSIVNVKSRGTSLTIKGLIIFFMTLILLIPMIFISELIRERLHRQVEVQNEVSNKWANSQTLTGPMLIVPYKKDEIKDKDGQVTGHTKGYLYILPEILNVEGVINPQTRHRSIFDVTVYQSELKFTGEFIPLDLEKLNISPNDLYPEKAQLYFGLSDFRGIEEQLSINWDNKSYELNVGDVSELFQANGLSSPVALTLDDLAKKHDFSLSINIKGSKDLLFVPIGKTNTTTLQSSWKNPSFTGSFLPNVPADISKSGFSANWKILYLNRNYPQVWKDQSYDVTGSTYGVTLLQSTDSYAKTDRSVKYAILFIALTFSLYFFVEILQKKKVHPLQYFLVGIALCVFYSLLLSIGEYLQFEYAYLIASAATIMLITLYTKSAFGRWKIASAFGLVLSALYGFIYILIQLQDGALLFGSIGLFLLLAVAMYYSRKIDWYGRQVND